MAIAAFARAVADDVRDIPALSAIKVLDEPCTTTGLQNDNDLRLIMDANSSYSFDFLLFCTGAALGSGDIKVTLTFASGNCTWVSEGISTSAVTVLPGSGVTSSASSRNFGVNGTQITKVKIEGTMLTGSSQVTLQLQWAEVTGNVGVPTNVLARSRARAWKHD
jgi:hypothetical protein